jgi:hypothetical protein
MGRNEMQDVARVAGGSLHDKPRLGEGKPLRTGNPRDWRINAETTAAIHRNTPEGRAERKAAREAAAQAKKDQWKTGGTIGRVLTQSQEEYTARQRRAAAGREQTELKRGRLR